MSEMVERVMREIAEKQHKGWLYDEAAVSLLHPVKVATIRDDLRMAARAAIEAMREPTADMLAAAHRNNHPRDLDTWQTMIDAALPKEV